MTAAIFLPPRAYTKELFNHIDQTLDLKDKKQETKITMVASFVFRLLVSYFVVFYAATVSCVYNSLSAVFDAVNYFTEKDEAKKTARKDKISLHIQYAMAEAALAGVVYVDIPRYLFTTIYSVAPEKITAGYEYLESKINTGKAKITTKPPSKTNTPDPTSQPSLLPKIKQLFFKK